MEDRDLNQMKARDLQKLKDFREINIAEICRKLGVNRANLMNGNASVHATHEVLKELVRELKKYIEKYV